MKPLHNKFRTGDTLQKTVNRLKHELDPCPPPPTIDLDHCLANPSFGWPRLSPLIKTLYDDAYNQRPSIYKEMK